MTFPFQFGHAERPLFGIRHDAAAERDVVLACAPLLQEALRSHRALWALGEALAAQGITTLRFDWYGSGDSGGRGRDVVFDGLLADLEAATALCGTPPRMLALRTASLPVVAHASAQARPVRLVLWDPLLSGRDVVARWRHQHWQQLHEVGRYHGRAPRAGADELLGFEVAPALLQALSLLELEDARLPAGSTLLLVAWESSPALERFAARQAAAGVAVEWLRLDADEQPRWEDPHVFEHQVFPRRGVAHLARHLAAAA